MSQRVRFFIFESSKTIERKSGQQNLGAEENGNFKCGIIY